MEEQAQNRAKVANGWAGAHGTSSIRQRCVADSVAEWSEFRDECKLMDGQTNRLDCFGQTSKVDNGSETFLAIFDSGVSA